MNYNKMVKEKGLKGNIRSGFVIGQLPLKRWNVPPQLFLLLSTTFGWYHFPKGRKPISGKWVFKIKHGVDGECKHLEWIIINPLHMWQSLCQFLVSLHQRPLKTWRFIKSTSKLYLSMVTLKRRSIWNNLRIVEDYDVDETQILETMWQISVASNQRHRQI